MCRRGLWEGRHTLATYLHDGVQALGIDLSGRSGTTTQRIQDMTPHAPGGDIGFAGGRHRLATVDESVDAVIASEILEHIPNYLAVLEESGEF